ncbi:MAG: Rpn family recombination-promoting nuclease/putative transposase [Prevotella sp.]|nr:Rpn family recombination-promoting nuclease/putative transposase [Prevotella sp.]
MKGNGPELIRFDWAMKRLLRDKVNHGILEGLITTLLNKKIRIQKLLESESNQDDADDKYNRVDILAEDENGGLYLIEVQNETEFAYFQRMLFGTSKLVTEYIKRGQGYENIRKVYSINIVYFNIGCGTDIVYHGKTEFRGIHNNELLNLSTFQKQKFEVSEVSELYPEYYILKVNDFNHWSKVPLEQWIYFLNTGEIPDDATAPGLNEAREKLQLERMTKAELNAYYHHLDNVVVLRDNIYTARNEGRIDGLAEGRAEKKAKREIAKQLKAMGLTADKIADATGLTLKEIEAIVIN